MRYCWMIALLLAGAVSASDWDPETAPLLFMSRDAGDADLYLRASDGSWTPLHSDPDGQNWAQWSPDGSRIAYQHWHKDGTIDIWVMNADGTNPRPLTTDPAHDYLPSWSPDGQQLTFASWRMEPGDDEQAVHLYIMNADGSGQRRLVKESPGLSAGLRWLPDGSGFIGPRKLGEAPAALYRVSLEGKFGDRFTDESCSCGMPSLSPDGAHLAYHCDDGETSKIVVVDIDGGNRRVLVSEGKNWTPYWSPDGRWITYTRPATAKDEQDLDIWVVPIDGSGPARPLVIGPGRQAEGTWPPFETGI